MEVRAGQEDVDAVLFRGLDRLGSRFDVWARAASQRGDARPAHLARDAADGIEIALRGDGEARLKHVNAERRQLVRHAELLFVMHGAAGALLSIAQRRVEKDDLLFR